MRSDAVLGALLLGAFAQAHAASPCPAEGGTRDAREACALAAVAAACAADPRADVAPVIARELGVPQLQVRRGVGRQTLGSLERGGLCDRGEDERRNLVAAAWQPKKQPTEAHMDWLHATLRGPGGDIDHVAVAHAFERREDLVAGTTLAKRAGLPAAPPIGAWTNLTGYAQSPGRINTIVFPTASGNDIIAGSDGGGLWRTTDGGATWSFINDFFGSLTISSLARNGAVIYAGTNTRGSHTYFPFGILKSVDGGTTWAQLVATSPGVNPAFAYVQRVAVHPADAQTVLAATEGGAYLSINGGTSWTLVGPATTAYDAGFHALDGNRRYVAYDDGTVRLTTTGDLAGAGASTVQVSPTGSGRYTRVSWARSDTNRLYALLSDSASATRLRMSVNGGGAWTDVAVPVDFFYNGGYPRYTGGLWVDPFNANRVAVCEGWAMETPDISQPAPAWKSLASGWVDFHGIVSDPGYDGTTNKRVFFMDDGGLYRVNDVDNLDQFAGFFRIETGLAVTQIYSASATRGGTPIYGAQDTGPRAYRTAVGDPVPRWRFLTNPANGFSWIGDGMTTAASRSNPNVVYGSRQYLDVFRSTDAGVNASSIVSGTAVNEGSPAGNYNASFYSPFLLDPTDDRRMLAAGHSLWQSLDVDTGNPPTWTKIAGPFADAGCPGYQSPIGAMAIAASNPAHAWVSNAYCTGKVFKSTNSTAASPVFGEVPLAAGMTNWTKGTIAIDRTNPNAVFISLAGYTTSTLYRATDGGVSPSSWLPVAGFPGAPVYAMTQHPANPRWWYAATGVGLLASVDNGATWSASNEGPANVVVRSLSWQTTGTVSQLLVGTYGRGVWRAAIPQANMDLAGDARSDVLYRNVSTGQVWRLYGNGLALGSGAMVYSEPNTAWKIVADGDFNGDGVTDLLWRNTSTGQVYVMPFNTSGVPVAGAVVHTEANAAWKIVATPDLDGDGRTDILWWNSSTGQVYAMLMNGTTIAAAGTAYVEPNTQWSIVATGDFAGSGRRNQLVWRNAASGAIYLMTLAHAGGAAFTTSGSTIYSEPNAAWKIVAAPDLDGDGRSDLLWRNETSGQVYAMIMGGGSILAQGTLHNEPNTAWKIVAQGDYNGDGRADLLWRNGTTGQVYMMLVGAGGLALQAQGMVYTEGNTAWRVMGPYEYAQ